MSNKELDNLFKNKLEDFGKAPSSSIWDKIDEQIDRPKKRSPWFYMSIAASLLLLLSLSFLFLKNDEINNKKQIAQKKDVAANAGDKKSEKIPTTVIDEIADIENEKSESTFKQKVIQPKKEEKTAPVNIPHPKNPETLVASNNEQNKKIETSKNEDLSANSEIIDFTEINQDETIAQNSTLDATIADPSASEKKSIDKGQTLEFDISQFANTKTVVAATETEKKESKLLQIFKIAKDIKEGESGLGEIRAVKNNLLALNGKKEGK